MYDKNALRQAYNLIAKDWHQEHLADTWWQESFERFCEMLPSEAAVLDIGCGGGVKTDLFRQKGFRSLGIDLSEGMIEIAKATYPDSDFQVLDMQDVGKLGKQFDGIYVLAVLLHAPKQQAEVLLRSWIECLKPGGLLFIGVKELLEGKSEEVVVQENDYGYPYERFFSFYTVDELRSLFSSLGLEMVYEQVDVSGRAHWIKMIGKKI